MQRSREEGGIGGYKKLLQRTMGRISRKNDSEWRQKNCSRVQIQQQHNVVRLAVWVFFAMQPSSRPPSLLAHFPPLFRMHKRESLLLPSSRLIVQIMRGHWRPTENPPYEKPSFSAPQRYLCPGLRSNNNNGRNNKRTNSFACVDFQNGYVHWGRNP